MTYQEKIKEAFQNLEDARILVFTALVNVAMHSEFKDVDELFEEGELLSFRNSDFDQASDPNIITLNETVKSIEFAQGELIALNNLDLLNDSEWE